jgi:hypothetical protein
VKRNPPLQRIPSSTSATRSAVCIDPVISNLDQRWHAPPLRTAPDEILTSSLRAESVSSVNGYGISHAE